MQDQKVLLALSAVNLRLGPDITISISAYSPQIKSIVEYCRIESSVYETNPNWSSSIVIPFRFEAIQRFSVKIQNQMGESIRTFNSTLAELLTKKENCFKFDSENEYLKAVLQVQTNYEELVDIQFRAHNVDKMDLFGKSDPYFVVLKENDNNWKVVYKSEIVKKNLDPIWKPFQVRLKELFSHNEGKIKIDVWDWDRGSSDDFIGSAEVSIRQLYNKDCRLKIINEKKKSKKKYDNSGILEVIQFEVQKKFSLFDYIKSGVKIRSIFGIDFTSSNLEHSHESSLHNLRNENCYLKLIESIGSVTTQYDSSKMVGLFGFGGQPSWLKGLTHCFSLNNESDYPFLEDIGKALDTYRKAVPYIKQSGPTLACPLISLSNSLSSTFESDLVYFVLTIIVDNSLNDIYQSISAIVMSSYLPVSIIFIGIGNDNFDEMLQLVSHPLHDENGKASIRKNTKFAELKRFNNNPDQLAAEILKDIPAQIEEFMQFINFNPS